MAIHRNNKPIQIEDRNGEPFRAAITHVETEGKHTVVVATSEQDLRKLQNSAADLVNMLAAYDGVPKGKLDFFERHANGSLFQVDHQNLGHGPDRYGAPEQHRERGKSVGEAEVKKNLEGAELPQVKQAEKYDLSKEPMPDLNQIKQKPKQQM